MIQEISDTEFESLIAKAIDELPEHYAREMSNVVITWSEEPSAEQRVKMKLRPYQTLFGLYEGIPMTQRGAGYNLVLPDKITIFKNPILYASQTRNDLMANIKHTLWHEIAHHYGLDHERIHKVEKPKTK
ncbi:MAG TPA: metallopeptidase family protein [Patescibacteria group bacterium]|nr:metallopeptidase family protein [Patescibacteria group bacterium]